MKGDIPVPGPIIIIGIWGLADRWNGFFNGGIIGIQEHILREAI